MVRLAVAFQRLPSWRLVGPQEPLGTRKHSVCVVFKSDSHGSMTHFRAAERQKLRSACMASAGPPGTTARLTWKKRMKEPLAIRPVPSLLSQVLPASHRKTSLSQNRHVGKLGLPLLGIRCPLRPVCPKGAGHWAPLAPLTADPLTGPPPVADWIKLPKDAYILIPGTKRYVMLPGKGALQV